MLKLLIVEGNSLEARKQAVAAGSICQSDLYEKTLLSLRPDARCRIIYPADEGQELPDGNMLENYHGIVWTGSSLNIYENDPAVTRQIEFMKICFESNVKIFGSCWGLQVAVVATGGEVQKNVNGREVGIARAITTTDAGKCHPLYKGKRGPFDANAIHLDHVNKIPQGATVLSGNENSLVQALEIKRGNTVFWGVQYHPEFDLKYMSYIFEKYKKMLVNEGICANEAEAVKISADYLDIHNNPNLEKVINEYKMGANVLEPCYRLKEVSNWLEFVEQSLN